MKVLLSILLVYATARAGDKLLAISNSKAGLAEHMLAQLASRTNGNSPNFTGPTDGSNWFQRPPTNTLNFWLRNVTNILAMSQGRIYATGIASCANYITPISPHICIGAAHTGGGIGTTNLWLRPDGSYYTNIIIAAMSPTNSRDIMLMFMAKTNWTFVKIFPDATNKLAFWRQPGSTNPVPVFIRFHQGIGRTNEFHSTFVSGSTSLGSFGQASKFTFGDYSKGDMWVGGDSSGAAYAIVQNEAVLVGCAWFGGYAMPVANYQSQINSTMAALCASNHVAAETISIYDLGDFPDE